MVHDDDVRDALRRNTVAVSSRLIALFLYGCMGFFVGLGMFFTGAPELIESAFGQDIRLYLGASAAVAGILLCIGAIQGARNPRGGWWASLLGTIIFGGWTITMAVTYTIAAFHHGFVIAMPGQDIPADAPRGYVPLLYQFLSDIIILHVITLLLLGRDRRAR